MIYQKQGVAEFKFDSPPWTSSYCVYTSCCVGVPGLATPLIRQLWGTLNPQLLTTRSHRLLFVQRLNRLLDMDRKSSRIGGLRGRCSIQLPKLCSVLGILRKGEIIPGSKLLRVGTGDYLLAIALHPMMASELKFVLRKRNLSTIV